MNADPKWASIATDDALAGSARIFRLQAAILQQRKLSEGLSLARVVHAALRSCLATARGTKASAAPELPGALIEPVQ